VKNISIQIIAIAASILLASCMGLQSYIQPLGNQIAILQFTNNAAEPLGIHIYEDAYDCKNKRRVIWIAPKSQISLSIKAPEATAYSINTEHWAGTKQVGNTTWLIQESCLSMFSFEPKVGGKYEVSYSPASSGGCLAEAIDATGAQQRPLILTRREFVRPLTDGSYCAKL
jgi:S-adenosylmethionine/arginine decarboxylase-like enzyme